MRAEVKSRLKTVIDFQFQKGINKKDMMAAMIRFVNENFVDRELSDDDALFSLLSDIRKAGTYNQWKKNLLMDLKSDIERNKKYGD